MKNQFQCNLCNMGFDDMTSYQNHKSKFCAGTDMHPSKTEQSFQIAKLNQTRKTNYDSQLLQSSIHNQTISDLLEQNDDEYQILRRKILEREKNPQNHNYTNQLHNDTISQLQEQMEKSVRAALFGQDEEMETLMKEIRERFMKEKEYLKDRDVIQRELKKGQRTQELNSLLTERDILQERYENFIKQVQEILQSKAGMKGKQNLERLIGLNQIKDSIENDRTRIMSMVFQIQSGEQKYNPRQLTAQNVLNNNSNFIDPAGVPSNQVQEVAQQWNLPVPEQPQEQIYYDPNQVQMDASQIDKNHENVSRLGQEIKMWMQGMDPALVKHAETHGTSIFDTMFSDKKEDYASMSQEEQRLINMIAQEADAKRALQRIPPYTPLYDEKLAQVNQISQLRADLERTVQEQRYWKIRENYDRINKDDDDTKIKQKIKQRVAASVEAWHGERKYQPYEGLVIHFDWILNIPRKYERNRLTWGIFLKGQTLHPPSIVEDRNSITHNYRTNMAQIMQHRFVYDIVANKDVILVIELQCYDENRNLDIYGWTLLELFDLQKNLIRGKFKLPFYPTNTNPSQLISADKPLRSVSNTLLYARIAYPFDYAQPALNPTSLTQEYYLTGIHSKTIIKPDTDHIKVPVRTKGYNPLAFDELFNQKKEFQEEIEEEEEILDEPKDEWQYRELGDQRKGLYVNIHELLNFFTPPNQKARVRCFLTDVRRGVIKDEKDVPCSFETDPYEAYDSASRGKMKFQNAILNGPFVFFEEEYQFFVDIETYAHNNKAWDDLYLIFQVHEIHEEVKEEKENEDDEDAADDGKSVKSKKSAVTTKTIQQKSKGVRWYAFKLFENNIMKIGRFQEFIFDPPIKKPPIDPIELKITNSQLDFTVNFFDYDMRYLDDQMEKFKMLRMLKKKQRGKEQEKKKPKEKKAKEQKLAYDWEKLPLSDRPFIENMKRVYKDRPFEKGFGIDFYIDQARFLPDNTTICKIIVQFMNTNLEKVFPPKSVLPDIKTTTYSPYFNFKQELRSPHFDPTMLAFITILTVDNTNKEVRIVGYAGINIFLSRQTKAQPSNPIDTDIVLMNGSYQIPIFCQHPTLIKPFNLSRMNKLDKLQCSTLLVRLYQAPMSDDGLKPLGMNDFSQKDWEMKGVWQRMPPYGTGYYNTELYQIRDVEKDLYNVRVQREDPAQTEIVARLLSYENIQKQMTLAETLSWLDQKLVRDAYTDIIELTYFAKYKPQVGFKISLDGFHNVPDTSHPIVAIYSINPPGRLYLDLGFDTRDVITSTSFNWDSPLQSPQYNEGYFKFKDIPFAKNAHLIIDVRKIIFSQKGTKAKIEKIGWTIVPLFTGNGFVKSGNYQMPVIAGQVPVEVVKEMQRGDPWEIVQEKLAMKKGLKYLSPMSAVVRLLDAQREGHFQHPFDHSRMIWSFIPQKKMSSYVYNAGVDAKLKDAKKLVNLAPNKDKLNDFNEKITKILYEVIQQSLGIKQDKNDSGRNDEQIQQI